MTRLRVLLVAVLAAFSSAASCPPPKDLAGTALRCGQREVHRQSLNLLGPVNDCLSLMVQGEAMACLDGLVKPAINVTIEVVACTVRDSVQRYAASAEANPHDVVSEKAAANGRSWLDARNVEFAD